MTISDSIKARFAFLLAIAGSGAGIYFVASNGQPTDDVAQVARVCALPGNVSLAILDALGIPHPTGPDGTGVGRCLPPADAEDGYRKLRVLGAILPKWRAANLTSVQCAAGLVSVEFSIPSLGVEAGSLPLIQVCGPAPALDDELENLARIPQTDVDIRWTSGKYARGSEPAIRLWTMGNYPAAFSAIAPCACCARGAACTVTGLNLPDGGTATGDGSPATQYCPSSRVTGAGKRPMPEGIHQMVIDRCGPNCTMPTDCR